MIKKALLTFSVMIGLLVPVAAVVPSAGAVDVLNPDGGACSNPNAADQPEVCKDNQTSSSSSPIVGPNGILTIAINILSLIVGVTAVIVIIIAGLKMITGGGDPSNTASARQAIVYALVGVVIAVIAQSIVALVLNKL